MKSSDRHDRLLVIGLSALAVVFLAIDSDALWIAAAALMLAMVARKPLAVAPPAA